MEEISKAELKEIILSYGLFDLIFDFSKQVDPDTTLYFFHDQKNIRYCLITSDYLEEAKLPCNFIYDYYLDKIVKFRAVKQIPYIKNASKRAKGYIDDNHYRTKASTGDVCMLFVVDKLKL